MYERTPHVTAIGLRVLSNHRVYYTIVTRTDTTLDYLDISFINVPMALSDPERLNFTRNTLLDILHQYSVTRAAIRISEISGNPPPRMTQLTVERSNLEGVLQEALASCAVERYVAGRKSTLAALVKCKSTQFQAFVDGTDDFDQFEADRTWAKLKREERESVLTSFAALHL